jgi:hypothetical protein
VRSNLGSIERCRDVERYFDISLSFKTKFFSRWINIYMLAFQNNADSKRLWIRTLLNCENLKGLDTSDENLSTTIVSRIRQALVSPKYAYRDPELHSLVSEFMALLRFFAPASSQTRKKPRVALVPVPASVPPSDPDPDPALPSDNAPAPGAVPDQPAAPIPIPNADANADANAKPETKAEEGDRKQETPKGKVNWTMMAEALTHNEMVARCKKQETADAVRSTFEAFKNEASRERYKYIYSIIFRIICISDIVTQLPLSEAIATFMRTFMSALPY